MSRSKIWGLLGPVLLFQLLGFQGLASEGTLVSRAKVLVEATEKYRFLVIGRPVGAPIDENNLLLNSALRQSEHLEPYNFIAVDISPMRQLLLDNMVYDVFLSKWPLKWEPREVVIWRHWIRNSPLVDGFNRLAAEVFNINRERYSMGRKPLRILAIGSDDGASMYQRFLKFLGSDEDAISRTHTRTIFYLSHDEAGTDSKDSLGSEIDRENPYLAYHVWLQGKLLPPERAELSRSQSESYDQYAALTRAAESHVLLPIQGFNAVLPLERSLDFSEKCEIYLLGAARFLKSG